MRIMAWARRQPFRGLWDFVLLFRRSVSPKKADWSRVAMWWRPGGERRMQFSFDHAIAENETQGTPGSSILRRLVDIWPPSAPTQPDAGVRGRLGPSLEKWQSVLSSGAQIEQPELDHLSGWRRPQGSPSISSAGRASISGRI